MAKKPSLGAPAGAPSIRLVTNSIAELIDLGFFWCSSHNGVTENRQRSLDDRMVDISVVAQADGGGVEKR